MVLARRVVVASMSRKGNCYDNASVESFFGSLKNQLVRHRQFREQAEAQLAIAEYIDGVLQLPAVTSGARLSQFRRVRTAVEWFFIHVL
jgi:transposase InsO family protein